MNVENRKKCDVKKKKMKSTWLPPLEIITVDILAELRSHAHTVFFSPFSLNLQRAFSHIIPFLQTCFPPLPPDNLNCFLSSVLWRHLVAICKTAAEPRLPVRKLGCVYRCWEIPRSGRSPVGNSSCVDRAAEFNTMTEHTHHL